MIPFFYSNHFWQLVIPPVFLVTTWMKRQAQDYERRIMQWGCVQPPQSVYTKGDSGKQDQESSLYSWSLLLPSMIHCNGEAADFLLPRQSVSQQKPKWTSASLGSRKQKLHSKIQSFVFKTGLIWMKKQQSNLSLWLLAFFVRWIHILDM